MEDFHITFLFKGLFECIKTYEILHSTDLALSKGDIIRIPKDCKANISKHSYGEFAVVLERYRITKEKPSGNFHDYGSVLMMLTGKNKGHIFKIASPAISSKCKYL